MWRVQRNGADYAVFINTGQEFDGSDAGARPDEAISWGKIRTDAAPVKVREDRHTEEKERKKERERERETDHTNAGMRAWYGRGWGQVYGDATILFPLLVAETFAQEHAAAHTQV
jgi:deoxyhypusine synthase